MSMIGILENRKNISAFHEFIDNHPELQNMHPIVQEVEALKHNVVSMDWAKEHWKGALSRLEKMGADKRK